MGTRKKWKPVILVAPPASKEESEAAKEFEKNGTLVHTTCEREIKILSYITKYVEGIKRKSG